MRDWEGMGSDVSESVVVFGSDVERVFQKGQKRTILHVVLSSDLGKPQLQSPRQHKK